MSTEDQLPVSGEDGLTGRDLHVRRLGEFKASNVPLSAAEVEHRERTVVSHHPEEWPPRTLKNVQDVNPLEDADEDPVDPAHRLR